MDDLKRRNREEREKRVFYSQEIKAGKRIYYLDVRKTKKDEMYLSITESKKISNDDSLDSPIQFEKHKIFLYREDFTKFIEGLSKTISFIREAERSEKDDNASYKAEDTKEKRTC